MTVLVTKPAVNIREELADLKDQTTYDTVKSAGAVMDAELTNEAAVKSIDQALTTTSDVQFNQVTGALVGNASTATALETARTISMTGDVTATGVSFDGSANISLTADIAANVVGATELNVTGNGTSGQVLASDGDGSFSWAGQGLSDTGTINTGITFADDAYLRVGTGTDLQIKSDGTDVEALLGSGSDLNIQASVNGFTFLSKPGASSNDTPLVGGAQNTYGSAATTGGGVGFSLRSPNGNGVSLNATTLYGRYSDVTNGSEDTYLQIYTYVAGTPTTVATFRGDQASTIPGSLSVTGALKQNGSDVLTTASGVLTTADVDDTPVDGVTTAPVSSNWAYDHENSTSAHPITSISGLGANVATFLGTPTSANLASAVTDETGSGALVFGTAPTLSQVHDDSTISYNGTDYGIGYRSIPAVSTTGAVTASAAHNGKCITANGTITVPSTLAVGTVISVWVNSASTISIEKSGGTMYLNGTSVTSVTAAAYGIATIYFPASSTMVVTGNVS